MSERPLRILYWTQLWWPYIGGVEVLGTRFVRELQARGHEVVVVTGHGSLPLPDQDEYEGIPVYRFPFHQALMESDINLLFQIRRAIADLKHTFQPDLVHVNLTDPGPLFHLQTNKTYPVPTLVTVPVALPSDGGQQHTLLGALLNEADWITTNSHAILTDLWQIAPQMVAQSSVIVNSLVRPTEAPTPLPWQPPIILCLGRVVPLKGFDLAIRALRTVVQQVPTVRLWIAGDGPERSRLEQLVAELGFSTAIEFLGWVPPEDVPTLLNATTVVVVPSRWREAFGLVALEAAHMARPVIASAIGGLPEVVADGETGLLVPAEDVPALAQAMLRLLEHHHEAQQMGARARERARHHFSWEHHVEEYVALYRRLT